MFDEITLIIEGDPIVKKGTQRPVRLPNGRWIKVDSPAYKRWLQNAVVQLLGFRKKKPAVPINIPVNLKCIFYRRTRVRVDLSALYEGIQDVLTKEGWLEDDNYNIVASHDGSRVFVDKETPRMEITITPRGEDDVK